MVFAWFGFGLVLVFSFVWFVSCLYFFLRGGLFLISASGLFDSVCGSPFSSDFWKVLHDLLALVQESFVEGVAI